MFFKWKRLYCLAEERIKQQREYIGNISKDKRTYDNIIENLNFILNKYQDHNINIYMRGKEIYYIVETWLPGIWENDYTVSFYTYKLDAFFLNNTPIAELSARLELNDSYKEKTAYIESIDTMRELRKGHASQLLKRLIYIAKHRDVKSIKGELLVNTPIGLDNLKKFYIKNGFEIKGNRFIMKL